MELLQKLVRCTSQDPLFTPVQPGPAGSRAVECLPRDGIHLQRCGHQRHDLLERSLPMAAARNNSGFKSSVSCDARAGDFPKKIDENPGFFNRRVARETANYARVFLLFYQRLAADDRAKFGEVRRCYKLTPKFHCMVNLAEYIEHSCRNPRCLARCQKFVVLSALACEFQIHRTRFKHPQMLVS